MSIFRDIVKKQEQIDGIKLVQGEKSVIQFYTDLPWDEMHDCTFSAESYEQLFPAETFYGTNSLDVLKQTKCRILLSKTPSIEHERCKRLLSISPQICFREIEDGKLVTDTMIFDDYVAIGYLDPQNLHAIKIKSKALVESYKAMFQRAWEKEYYT